MSLGRAGSSPVPGSSPHTIINKIMDDLKNRLMEKIGLDADKSQETIQLVVDFIKERIPENLHGMVDSMLSGGGDDDDDGGGPLDAIKGMFG